MKVIEEINDRQKKDVYEKSLCSLKRFKNKIFPKIIIIITKTDLCTQCKEWYCSEDKPVVMLDNIFKKIRCICIRLINQTNV